MILLDLLVRATLAAVLLAFVVGAVALLLTPPRRDSHRAARGPVEDLSWLDLMDAARDHPRTVDHVTTCRACLADYETEVQG